jgi:glycerate dehydrogenase
MKLVVLDGYCLNPGDLSWGECEALVSEMLVFDRTPEDEVVTRCAGAELVMTNKTPLTAGSMRQLPSLLYIGVLATGYDMVDIATAKEKGVVVTNIPTYGTESVAQHAFALLLELCNRTGMHSQAVHAGEWSRSPDWSFWKSPLVELAGKTMGVIGFGRIGRQTARIADAMGMRVIANDTYPGNAPPYEGFRWASVEELLAESDVVSLHCPLTAENERMIDARRLRLMKKTAFLINTSRGPLVADQDLADALREGAIAGAGLDVLPVEPPVSGNPLLGAKNCVLTPHIAWATKEARSRLMRTATGNLRAYLSGAARNVVG